MSEDERPQETFEAPDLGPMHSSGYPEYADYSPQVAGAIPHWGGVPDPDMIDYEEYAPLCLIHGTDDTTVPYDSGYCFANYGLSFMPYMYGSHAIVSHLNDIGIADYEFHPFEGEGHNFYLSVSGQINEGKFNACFDIVRDFLLLHLNFPTSTSEMLSHEVALFPNPTSHDITVDMPRVSQGEPCRIRITNVYGQELVSEILTASNPNYDVSHWSSGVYMVQIEWEGGRLCNKFIKR